MSDENVQLVIRFGAIFGIDDVMTLVSDPGRIDELTPALAEVAEPDFETTMVGPDYMRRNREQTGRGAEGLRDLWEEWLIPFESFRVEPREILDAGDKVLLLGRQIGVTKTGGVEVDNDAAAVFTIRNGRVARVEFHLDVDEARRAAGLDG